MPVRTVNRQCSSGLQAVADVAAAIRAGFYDIGKRCIQVFGISYITLSLNTLSYLQLFCVGIGAGLESMTTNPMAWEGSVNPKVFLPLLNSFPSDCI